MKVIIVFGALICSVLPSELLTTTQSSPQLYVSEVYNPIPRRNRFSNDDCGMYDFAVKNCHNTFFTNEITYKFTAIKKV